MRVAVIGARCRHQGIGEHLARFCAQAGATVCAVMGTSEHTAVEAARVLQASTGQQARPHTSLDTVLEHERLDALVIASPVETHASYLERALAARLHVLCEKPLVWGTSDPAADAEHIADAYVAAGLHLAVNAQWPHTLPTYRRLFPDVFERTPERFFMRLSPRSRGARMVVDSLTHPLSLLAAVLPDPEAGLDDVDVALQRGDAERAVVTFRYRAAGADVSCRVELQQCLDPPRPAAFGFDGRIARRRVDLQDYGLSLDSGRLRIPLPDPTPLLVGSFLAAVRAGTLPVVDPAARPGMRHLARIALP